jgi:hypothetical protein
LGLSRKEAAQVERMGGGASSEREENDTEGFHVDER